eukprot:6143798-Prymnesium_polylepis.2
MQRAERLECRNARGRKKDGKLLERLVELGVLQLDNLKIGEQRARAERDVAHAAQAQRGEGLDRPLHDEVTEAHTRRPLVLAKRRESVAAARTVAALAEPRHPLVQLGAVAAGHLDLAVAQFVVIAIGEQLMPHCPQCQLIRCSLLCHAEVKRLGLRRPRCGRRSRRRQLRPRRRLDCRFRQRRKAQPATLSAEGVGHGLRGSEGTRARVSRKTTHASTAPRQGPMARSYDRACTYLPVA